MIVGVHTPEFAFEHVASNVRAAVKRLGDPLPGRAGQQVRHLDAYSNQYWPAEYLIDRNGHVRARPLRRGRLRRDRAGDPHAARRRRRRRRRRSPTRPRPGCTTPESYLGYERLDRYAATPIDARPSRRLHATPARARCRATASRTAGAWRVEAERIVAGRGARLRAALPGEGRLPRARRQGRRRRARRRASRRGRCTSTRYRLYTLRSSPQLANALLELRFTPGVQAYAFTFG